MELAQKLKQARLDAGLSQKALCGDRITRNMLSLIESGKARPSMDTLAFFAKTLGKPMGYFLEEQAVEQLKDNAQVISRFAQAVYTDESISNHDFIVALSFCDALTVSDTAVFDASGKLLMCSHAPLGCEHRGLTLNRSYVDRIMSTGCAMDTFQLTGLYDENRYVVAMPVSDAETGKIFCMIMVSVPVSASRAVLDRIFDIYVFISVLVAVISAVLMTLFARKQSDPLKTLADTARAFGHGDLDARVRLEGHHPPDMEDLALAFNNMASSLQKSEYQRQEFVANVSHELKTPMTTIAGYIDGILDGTIPPEKSRQYLGIVSDETKRLSRLVRSMLDISRLQDQSGIPEDQKRRFDVLECAGQVLISFERKINEKLLDVQVDMPEHPVFTYASEDAITQVIYNLVDNAVKFCPEGGVLSLFVRIGGNKVYVGVANSGQTIPQDELALMFDRFHKLDKSRAENRDSWGLGLYIVKTIIGAHGENISVVSRDGRTEFTFTLPLVN